ncbi:MAG: ABC transporter permease [Bacteroidetes bacterium]|nr:ABC transporter permease [Bacteroidota bacterium]
MIKSYIRIALRSLRKNKIYSSINIIGLAVGLAVFWLMALYITDELTFDRFWTNSPRIYRVAQSAEWSSGSFHLAITAPPFGPTLKKDYPEVEEFARIDPEGGGTLLYSDKKITAGDIFFTDNSFLTIFRPPFLFGDASNALSKPNSIILTNTLAKKLFGKPETALNKTITFQNGGPSLVTGVIADLPTNAHLGFSALRSMGELPNDAWKDSYLQTYVMLRPGADINNLRSRLPSFYDNHLKEPVGKVNKYELDLQPITSIHLHSNYDYEIGRNSNIRYIYLFAAVALLVLSIAIINYINLATARSSIRVKEIGVRKVIGAERKQLVGLFLMESVIFTLISGAIATLLASLFLPAFNILAGKELSLWEFGTATTSTILITFTILIGLLGGVYPALFLSGFRTIPALKGQQGNMSATTFFRKSLVTFQFVITIILIAGSSILYLQLHFMQNKDLGFNKDQVLSFHLHTNQAREKVESLKAELLRDPSIESASTAGNPIGNNDLNTNAFNFEEHGAISANSRLAHRLFVDADFLPTLQTHLQAGRNFSAAQPTDKDGSVIINETLANQLGWTDPIGKRVQTTIGADRHNAIATVIGVVKDFNMYSLQHKIEPLVLQMPPVRQEEDNVYVRIGKGKIPQGLKHIEAVYHKMEPASSFEYSFLDENFSRQYAVERKQGSLLLTFTVLAIFIACLGLFGLVTFSVGQRTKEIGVRKVLGSSVTGIVVLISKELIKPVIVAILISTPIAWYAMNRWLESFAYRININIWIFLAAGALAVIIAIVTVGWKSMQAATSNPVKSLRTE